MQLQHQVPEKVPEKVPEGSGSFRCRWLMRFRRVPVQMVDEVPESFGADSSGGFRGRWLMRLWRVPGQIADEVPEVSSADSRQGSGGFRGRKLRLMRFRQAPGQMADEVPESSGQIAKNSPRSSKLLGITHEFIFTILLYFVEDSHILMIGAKGPFRAPLPPRGSSQPPRRPRTAFQWLDVYIFL